MLPTERAAVVRAGRRLAEAGLVRGTSGNVSLRDPGAGAIAVTPTGVDYRALEPADVPVLDAEGARLDGGLEPSSELALHLAVYAARPDVYAVVHTHSMFATTFAVLGEPIPPVHYLLARAGGQVPVAPYARYGTAELADCCVRTLGSGGAVLLANHGVVAVGADLNTAMNIAEAVEFTAELAWRAGQRGTPVLLDEAAMAEAGAALGDYGQPGR